MSDQDHIKSLVKEAEIYRGQGLFVASREKYLHILQFIEKNKQLCRDTKLVNVVKQKIVNLEKDVAGLHQETAVPELSQEVQGLIKKLFSFSNNEGAAAMEGAVALAKFGQYEAALAEFHRLLKEGTFPLMAAKNILRCHLALSSPNAVIDQFGQWVSGNLLSKEQLKQTRAFLANVLEKRGIKTKLPEIVGASSVTDQSSEPEEVLDISSVRVQLGHGPDKGSVVEFDVSFQSGNIISVIVSAKQKDLADTFSLGIRLPDIQFYSPIAIFRGSGIVSGKTKIKSGPKRGDYMLDIKIDSV
jgi:hypothetical protein